MIEAVNDAKEALARAHEAKTTEAAVEDLLFAYAAAADAIEGLKAIQAVARLELEEIMVETGKQRVRSPSGMASWQMSKETPYYDRKDLDKLIMEDESAAALLRPLRKTRTTKGSVRITRPKKEG
jgi:hypothetical protein